MNITLTSGYSNININSLADVSLDTVKDTCNYHHTSLAVGYVSRKNDTVIIEEYSGRFGNGYKVHRACWQSTNYHFVSYYIRKESEK